MFSAKCPNDDYTNIDPPAKFTTTLESISEESPEIGSQYNFSFFVTSDKLDYTKETLNNAHIPFTISRRIIELCLIRPTHEELAFIRNLIKYCSS